MEATPWGWWRRAMAILGLFLAVGCDGEEARALRVAVAVTLPSGAATTLSVDPAGRHWLGEPGAVRIRNPSGTWAALPLSGTVAPRVLGRMAGSTYLRLGDTVMVASAAEDSVGALRGGFEDDPLLLDVRGRALLHGAGSGAVLAYDPQTVEPIWAWPARGISTAALAASPEGDRIYHALGSDGGQSRVLIRDLQTGREIATVHFPATFDRLEAHSDGRLYGVAREGRRVAVIALQPEGRQLRLLWRRLFEVPEAGVEVRIALGVGDLAVWGLGPEEGLRLLDATNGTVLGRTGTDPLDAAFSPGGELWVLYPGELRRLE